MQAASTVQKMSAQQSRLRDYTPLGVGVLLVISLSFISLALRPAGSSMGDSLMNSTMGYFFLVFGIPKLFDISGFTESFRQYDFIAHRFTNYARIYPFIEISLGLAYLSSFVTGSMATAMITDGIVVILTTLAIVSISRSLRTGKQLSCACIGSFFKFPLSKVALGENGIMLVMALGMLVFAHTPHAVMALLPRIGGW